jgi:WD40 repeat protein
MDPPSEMSCMIRNVHTGYKARLLGALICVPSLGRAADLLPGRAVGSGLVVQLAHSPDGRLLAILTTAGFQVRDARDGRLLNSVVHDVRVGRGLSWSPDGKRLAMAADRVEVWDALGRRAERSFSSDPKDGELDDVTWSPDGKQIAAGSRQAVVIFDLASGNSASIPGEADRYSIGNIKGGFSWAPDSGQLAVLSGAWDSEELILWDVRQQKLVRRFSVSNGKKPVCHEDACDFRQWARMFPKSLVAWSPNGLTVAVCSEYSGLSMWGVDSRLRWKSAEQFGNGDQPRMFLAWSSDGKKLHVGTASGLRYMRGDTGATAFKSANNHSMTPISISADELNRAAWSTAGVDLWQGEEKSPRAHIEVSMAWNFLAVSQDLKKMVARSMTGVDQIWDLDAGTILERLPASVIGGFNSGWSPHLDLLAHVDRRNLEVVRVRDGSVQRAAKLPQGWYSLDSASWSPDGESLIVRGIEGTSSLVFALGSGVVKEPPGSGLLVWGPSGELMRLPGERSQSCLQTADRRWTVAFDSSWPAWKVWDTSLNPPAPGPELPMDPIREKGSMAALSPDGKRIARVTRPEVVDIWDIAAGRIVEYFTATGASQIEGLVWREKLTAIDWLRGAVRLWEEP